MQLLSQPGKNNETISSVYRVLDFLADFFVFIVSRLYPVSILRKSISGRHRPVRVADGPMTARCRFTQNASWVGSSERDTNDVNIC